MLLSKYICVIPKKSLRIVTGFSYRSLLDDPQFQHSVTQLQPATPVPTSAPSPAGSQDHKEMTGVSDAPPADPNTENPSTADAQKTSECDSNLTEEELKMRESIRRCKSDRILFDVPKNRRL